MPKLTHKYLLSSQCFGRRPSVFVLHIAFWSVEWTDLALLFIVHFRFLNMNFQVKRIFFHISYSRNYSKLNKTLNKKNVPR